MAMKKAPASHGAGAFFEPRFEPLMGFKKRFLGFEMVYFCWCKSMVKKKKTLDLQGFSVVRPVRFERMTFRVGV